MCGIAAGEHSTQTNMIELLYVNKLLKVGEMPTLKLHGSDSQMNLKKTRSTMAID